MNGGLAEQGDVPPASVVVPAHNEERSIGRLLDQLLDGEGAPEVVVVCNGCTDGTAEVARARRVTVIEVAEPGKSNALRVGDEVASRYPRFYVDADVEITGESIRRLAEVLRVGPYLAAGPRRQLPRTGASLPVRWYYDVWEALPQVRDGLFARGVIALSEAGHARVRALPPAMADDLAAAEAFARHERTIVDGAVVVVHPARTLRDLVRRRTRVRTGNAQADLGGLRGADARTTPRTLLGIGFRHPSLLPKVAVFAAVTAASHRAARRAVRSQDFTTWHRDESSRK